LKSIQKVNAAAQKDEPAKKKPEEPAPPPANVVALTGAALTARSEREAGLKSASAAFERDVAAAQKVYQEKLKTALKDAMQAGRLEQANAIDTELKALANSAPPDPTKKVAATTADRKKPLSFADDPFTARFVGAWYMHLCNGRPFEQIKYISPDGILYYSGSRDDTEKLFRHGDFLYGQSKKGYFNELRISPDGNRIFFTNWDAGKRKGLEDHPPPWAREEGVRLGPAIFGDVIPAKPAPDRQEP